MSVSIKASLDRTLRNGYSQAFELTHHLTAITLFLSYDCTFTFLDHVINFHTLQKKTKSKEVLVAIWHCALADWPWGDRSVQGVQGVAMGEFCSGGLGFLRPFRQTWSQCHATRPIGDMSGNTDRMEPSAEQLRQF